MSRYDNAYGTISIPKGQWVAFKTELRSQFNDAIESDFQTLKSVHARSAALLKGKRNLNLYEELKSFYLRREEDFKLISSYDEMVDFITKHNVRTAGLILKAPVKKEMPARALAMCTRYPLMHRGEEVGSIRLDHDSACVTWQVPYNNKAVRDANASFMGSAFWHALQGIKWTPNSGGAIYGNDEYHRDSNDTSDYILAHFGPRGAKINGIEFARATRDITQAGIARRAKGSRT